jgi:zinc/manganese transport system permease protein
MLPIVQILGIPFIACVLMSAILGYLGIHVLKREVIFIDIALAQVAAVGSIAAHLIFREHGGPLTAYVCSLCCVLLAAASYAYVRGRIFQISLEAIIGISYAVAAAIALFLLGIVPGGHTHIHHILSGSLLWTNWQQVIVILIAFSLIGSGFYLIRKPIAELSNGYRNGIRTDSKAVFWDFVFYLLFGAVITLSVQIGGVVVVFAYLIMPATVAAILSTKLQVQIAIVWIAAIIASLGGLIFSYYLDFSIGPSIALFLGAELATVVLISKFRQVIAHRANEEV